MVAKENKISTAPIVKWIGSHQPNIVVPKLAHLDVLYYKKCITGPLTLSVGDFVLVSNADANEPDTVEGCDIAQILHLYDLQDEMSKKDPYRAIVQWYSRPCDIPHTSFDSDDIIIDFDFEIVEDQRNFDPDISLESIFRKCIVILGKPEDLCIDLLNKFKYKSGPMFVCRYKFIKVRSKVYRLVPLQFASNPDEVTTPVDPEKQRKSKLLPNLDAVDETGGRGGSARKHQNATAVDTTKRRRASVAATTEVEFVNTDTFSHKTKVSPIKIIGGKSVVRLSSSNKKAATSGSKNGTSGLKHATNALKHCASPLAENIMHTPSQLSRGVTARRNLNLSLENEADSTAGSDCLNYSIVNDSSDRTQLGDNMKIKLRISERRRSRLISADSIQEEDEQDPLAFEDTSKQNKKKRLGVNENCTTGTSDIYCTPTKKAKETPCGTTPTTARRKSILKSATTRAADGTPKRSIQLSNIVEKRYFQDDDIISTPKRRAINKVAESVPDLATPKRNRRSSATTMPTTPAVNTPLTPSQKLRLIRTGEISPSIDQRQSTAKKSNKTTKSDLQLVREHLHVSVVPQSLPCREKEFENIFTFLEGKIRDQTGGCMYVSGVPGTGKTATVTGVVRTLKKQVSQDKLHAFEFLEINGMRLTEPRQAYVQIYKQLTGKTVAWEQAHSLLEKRFTTPAPRRLTTVLLVDELDILCNRRQDVVYNLLDWPTKTAARLVVVAIANTMDLPERLLMGKVTSRLGLTRLTFQPYTHKQLQEIVTVRLSGSEAFNPDAVQLVARKVAAVSGDARRALDICRRATEIADANVVGNSKLSASVSMLHVQQALGEMIASAKVQSIKNCSRLEQIFLQAVVSEVTRTGVEETSFLGVYTQMESIATVMGATIPNVGRALQICSKLGAERLLICEHSRQDIFQKILLNVCTDDVHYALRVNA